MAKNKKNDSGDSGRDSIGIVLEQIGPPVANVLVSFFSVKFLKKNLDIIKISPFFSWIFNLLLPDKGLGKTLADIQQEIFAKQLIVAAEAKINRPEQFADRSHIWQNLKEKIDNFKKDRPDLSSGLDEIPEKLEGVGKKITEWLEKNHPLEKINQEVGEWAMRQWNSKEKAPANLEDWAKKSAEFRQKHWRK